MNLNILTLDYTDNIEIGTSVVDKIHIKPPKPEPLWKVILYNSDHYFHEVEFQLQKATGCSLEQAKHIAIQVHINSKAVAYIGEKHQCERVAAILRQIELIVTLEKDA